METSILVLIVYTLNRYEDQLIKQGERLASLQLVEEELQEARRGGGSESGERVKEVRGRGGREARDAGRGGGKEGCVVV